jgi:hypothetical protein|uniref:Uncharacterized protein n=1 Tax=viral metagenome TaxID=1070528 RepID=A0A6C0JD40_9ZZZZ
MLFRNKQGNLININRLDFSDDRQYFIYIQKIVNDRNSHTMKVNQKITQSTGKSSGNCETAIINKLMFCMNR